MGKLWYDTEGKNMQLGGVRKKWKLTWKVLRISSREDCYEATSIPVKQGADGKWAIYDEFLVKDGKGDTLSTHYKKHEFGVLVADLSNPDAPVRKDYLDEYIAAHISNVAAPTTAEPLAEQHDSGRAKKRRKIG